MLLRVSQHSFQFQWSLPSFLPSFQALSFRPLAFVTMGSALRTPSRPFQHGLTVFRKDPRLTFPFTLYTTGIVYHACISGKNPCAILPQKTPCRVCVVVRRRQKRKWGAILIQVPVEIAVIC
jgi:hypothetical protein